MCKKKATTNTTYIKKINNNELNKLYYSNGVGSDLGVREKGAQINFQK